MTGPGSSRSASPAITVGIDGSNLRGGGGITHLVSLLAECRPERDGIRRIVVWAPQRTLDSLPDRPFLEKAVPPLLRLGAMGRRLFQWRALPKVVARAGCDVLFCPGGTTPRRVSPVVVMYRNSLTFEDDELHRYPPWSVMRLKLEMLRRVHRRSLATADGVIVLSEHAEQLMRSQGIRRSVTRIPHGVQERFRTPATGSGASPGRQVLYVSSVAVYKHQWTVVESVALLRTAGHPVTLRLVGPIIDRASMRRLGRALRKFDRGGDWAAFRGSVPYDRLHEEYQGADAFVFASTCENMPNTLLEAMASGLAIVSSASGPMPEVAADTVLYADPEDPASLAAQLQRILTDPSLAADLGRRAAERAASYTWEKTTAETFAYLGAVARRSPTRRDDNRA